MSDPTIRFTDRFCFVLKNGTEVFPVRMKRQGSDEIAFCVSQKGNRREDALEVEEDEMERLVFREGYAVRCQPRNKATAPSLYRIGGNKVREARWFHPAPSEK